MAKSKKRIVIFILAALLAVCSVLVFTGVVAQERAAASPKALWSLPQGVTAEENTPVPDYMLYGKELDTDNNLTEYTQGSDLNLEAWQQNGIKFTASAVNRWVEFGNVVDISEYTKEDVLLAFTPLASARGNTDFNEFDVKITDAEDEDNYILIKIRPSQWFPATFTAETADMGPLGYQYGDYRANYDGGLSSFNDKYHVGFDGTTNESALVSNELKFDKSEARHRSIILHYDFADKAIWVTGQQGWVYCIMDLDWSESVGYGHEWEGFSSGKVKLSFCSKQHRSSEPSYMVLNAFNTPMNGTSVTDTEAPVISFGPEVQGTSAPSALVDKAYKLPTYTCTDAVSGDLTCNVTVKGPDGESVSLNEDGTLTATKAGFYTLTYSAADAAGNPVSRTLRITASKAVPAVTVEPEAAQADVTVGQEVNVPEVTITAAEGAYIVNSSVKVVRSGSETVTVEDGKFVPLFAGDYRIEYAATDWLGYTHAAIVTVKVDAGSGTATHGQLQQLRRLFDGVRVTLPEVYAYDYKTVPGVGIAKTATVTLTGTGDKANVSETLPAGSVFTPDKEKFGDTLKVTYKVGGETVKEYTVDIWDRPDEDADDYVDDGEYQLENYFELGDGTQVDYNGADDKLEHYYIVADNHVDSGDAAVGDGENGPAVGDGTGATRTFGFVNPLRGDGFELSFFVPVAHRNFKSITIKLRDSFDASVGFDIKLEDITSSNNPSFANSYTFLTTNGGEKYTLLGTYNYMRNAAKEGEAAKWEEVSSMLTIVYRDGAIYDRNGDEVCKITENFDGKSSWNGFPSGQLYFDMVIEGVGALPNVIDPEDKNAEIGDDAAIALSALCGQAFFVEWKDEDGLENFSDTIAPQVVLVGSFPENVAIGNVVEIPILAAYDALSPYVEVTVTVQAPDGSAVYMNEPLTEGLTFTVNSFGTYFVRYTATDASGNVRSSTYSVSAADTTAPTIALSGYEDLQGKAGKKVNIPTAVVQDERDTAPRLFIYVIDPSAAMECLGEVTVENAITSFTPEVAGEYTVLYYAIDADYNAAIETVTVVIE